MPKVKLIAPEILKVYADASEVFLAHKVDVGRIKSLRPSQLPFCPAAFFINHAKQGVIRAANLATDFYTSVGTAVHTTLQKYLSTSGKFLASWHCRQCGKKYKVTMQNECCDMVMDYHEIEIDYKGIVGHIDAVYRDSLGRYWILDFKTCSVAGAPRKKTDPGAAYIEQVEAYALTLWLQYGIKVHGVMLMFIPRNSPKEPVIWEKVLREDDFARIKHRMVKYKKRHKEVLQVSTKAEALALVDYGRCKGAYCKVCRSSRSLKLQIKEAYAIGLERGRIPLKSLCR